MRERERSGGRSQLIQIVYSLVEIAIRNWAVRFTVSFGFCEGSYHCSTKLQEIPSLQALSPFLAFTYQQDNHNEGPPTRIII